MHKSYDLYSSECITLNTLVAFNLLVAIRENRKQPTQFAILIMHNRVYYYKPSHV